MPNKLAIIVDYFLEVTNQGPENYKRHLRPAKELLVLCDGSTEKAKEIIDKSKLKFVGLDWSLWQSIKKYLEITHE